MPTFHGGRHEYGQNFLNDPKVVRDVMAVVEKTTGPIIEIGPGGGALTAPLSRLSRPLTAVEIDPRQIKHLNKVLPDVRVEHGDFLRHRLPTGPHVIVGNVPFHITTAVLRKLLHSSGWTESVLIVQWEVARRRAGVGGASMMTAQWWPWINFSVHGRIPSSAFTPRPGVDAGLLLMKRRTVPLLPDSEQAAYRGFVHAVFTGKGKGLHQILQRQLRGRAAGVKNWLRTEGISPAALPKDLRPEQWAGLYGLAVESGWHPRR